MLSPEEIRALEGESLSDFAFVLGLAPTGAYLRGVDVLCRYGAPWIPHIDLDTASVVFRGLRRREWRTTVTATWRSGQCMATWPYAPYYTIRCTWDGVEHTEARALLLASVLAVASRQEGAP